MRYDAYEPLIAPARPTSGLMFLAAGIVLTVLAYITLNYLIWMVVHAVLPADMGAGLSHAINQTRSPGGVIANLAIFGLLTAALAITLRVLHHRSLRSLTGPVPLGILQFKRVLLALSLLFVVVYVLPVPDHFATRPNLPVNRWVLLLPLTVGALLIQVSAEELAFRGYIQSQLAARFPSPLIWIGLPSLFFGVVHYDPTLPTANAVIVVLWASFFGAAAADLTARSGTLGPAIALHAVNNFNAVAIAAPDGSFDGLALYTYPFSMASSDALYFWGPVDLMILFCSWLAARLALSR